MKIYIGQAISMMKKYLQARLVPMLVGSPGVGKSGIVHQIANEYGLMVIDLRLSQCDPTDLLGFPTVGDKKADYVPMATFPIEGDVIPDGYTGWLLFLDEFNGAPITVQKAAYKLVLDRMVGSHHLHKNVAIICAGNLETDAAAVEAMSTALQSRLVHLELVINHIEWCNWASEENIDHRITSFINFKPGNLYTFRADHTDSTYACPRTWEFAHKVLQVTDESDKDFLPMLAGTLSEGIAREFVGFCKIHHTLPKIADIIKAPEAVKVPSEPSIMFALIGSIAHNATIDNVKRLMLYLPRIPMEFQIVCLREMIRRNKEVLKDSSVQAWVNSNSLALF